MDSSYIRESTKEAIYQQFGPNRPGPRNVLSYMWIGMIDYQLRSLAREMQMTTVRWKLHGRRKTAVHNEILALEKILLLAERGFDYEETRAIRVLTKSINKNRRIFRQDVIHQFPV